MNPSRIFIPLAVVLSLLLASCAPAAAPATQAASVPESITATSVPPGSGLPPLAQVNLTGPAAGTPMVWVDNSILVYVPAGTFEMGMVNGLDNPSHVVDVSGFWIYRSKVTNAQYALCVAAGICTPPQDQNVLTEMQSPLLRDRPILAVDWNQADAYCKWVNGHLPTEAQWEKTARGPDSHIYPWGDAQPTCDLLNANNCIGVTTPVNNYPAGKSYYEALDMAGNAYEWIQDWYDANYYYNSPALDPAGPATAQPGTGRVVRGSGYTSAFDTVSSANRYYEDPLMYRLDRGFRCVVDAPTQPVPYCEAAARKSTGSDVPSSCQPPSVQVGGQYCSGKSPYTNLITAGSVDTVTSAALNCVDQGGGIWACTGPAQSKAEVTVCSCGAGSGLPASIPSKPSECPIGYELNADGNVCLADPDTDGDPVCPSGFSPYLSGSSTVCVADTVPSIPAIPSVPSIPCPVGTYYDAAVNSCVGITTGTQTCQPGFNYDAAGTCCRSAIQPNGLVLNAYPGCAVGEYFDPTLASCVSADSSGSCVTLEVQTISCGGGGGRGDGNGGTASCAGLDYDSCSATQGCIWGNNGCESGP
jgi:formylglycine-generating enzyme required for sulfatase activity